MSIAQHTYAFLAMAGVMSFACSREEQPERLSGWQTSSKGSAINIAFGLDYETQPGAQLGGESALELGVTIASFLYRISCPGQPDVEVAQSPVTLYGSHANCVAKLLKFTTSMGVNFIPKTGSEFTSYTVNSLATFAGSDGVSEAVLRVVTQLPSVLAGNVSVQYGIQSATHSGSVNVSQNIACTSSTFSVSGELAPQLALKSAVLSNISLTTVGLNLTFECQEDVMGTSLETATCANDPMRSFKIATGVESSPTSISQLQALMAGPSSFSSATTLFLPKNSPSASKGGLSVVRSFAQLGFSLADLTRGRLIVVSRDILPHTAFHLTKLTASSTPAPESVSLGDMAIGVTGPLGIGADGSSYDVVNEGGACFKLRRNSLVQGLCMHGFKPFMGFRFIAASVGADLQLWKLNGAVVKTGCHSISCNASYACTCTTGATTVNFSTSY